MPQPPRDWKAEFTALSQGFTQPAPAHTTASKPAKAPLPIRPATQRKVKSESSSLTVDAPPPANTDAERTILGAILLDNAAHSEAAEKLETDDFSLDSHQRIFRRMSELVSEQRAVDYVTLTDALERHKEISTVGGRAYVASLTEGLPLRPVIGEYIGIVKEKAALRRLMSLCERATARAQDQSESSADIHEWMESELAAQRLKLDGSTSGLALLKGTEIIEREEPTILASHIPDNTLIAIHGPGGIGKSTLAILVAADLSRGRVPFSGAPCEPRNVLVLTNEDSPSRIRKIFKAASGDLSRLFVENTDDGWLLSDLKRLEKTILELNIGFLVIDSLASHSGKADLNSHGETTGMLVPARVIAEKHSCLICVVHHYRKGASTDHTMKSAGSVGIQNSARHNLHVVVDPDDPDMRLLCNGKSNLLPPNVPALRFEVTPPRWAGESTLTISDVLEQQAEDSKESGSHSAVDRAQEWLKDILAQGSREQSEIVQLAKGEGISEATLRRAKKALNVCSRKAAFGGQWFWWLEGRETNSAEEGSVQ